MKRGKLTGSDSGGSLVIPTEYDSVENIGNRSFKCRKGDGIAIIEV